MIYPIICIDRMIGSAAQSGTIIKLNHYHFHFTGQTSLNNWPQTNSRPDQVANLNYLNWSRPKFSLYHCAGYQTAIIMKASTVLESVLADVADRLRSQGGQLIGQVADGAILGADGADALNQMDGVRDKEILQGLCKPDQAVDAAIVLDHVDARLEMLLDL